MNRLATTVFRSCKDHPVVAVAALISASDIVADPFLHDTRAGFI